MFLIHPPDTLSQPIIRPAPLPGYRLCAGIVLFNADGLIFVGQRADDTAGSWQMPQGGIDTGEEPHRAAGRELYEETGIDDVRWLAELSGWVHYDLPSELRGRALGGKYHGQAQRWFAARYLGVDGTICLDHHIQEFTAWRWSDIDGVVSGIVPFKREAYRVVAEAFRVFSVDSRE